MEGLMKEVEGKLKFSVADSTMMLLVQQAMDKAHEKIKSGHCVLLRLNAISVFYEFAVMQLDSCLSFVQQETDNSVLESNHKEVLYDLREIRDRLHHRLLETELAIVEKDREILEMSENEQKMKQVLESKETELVHLQEDLERKRSNEIEEFIQSNKEGEISELKSSVDQQVMNIRQKLKPEYKLLEQGKPNPGVDNTKIEKMGVDIDALKGTMDLAFSKMHNAIFLSELGPIEQKWRWKIEKDTVAILIKGFMENCRSDFEEERDKIKREASAMFRDYVTGFAEQVSSIRREVECLAIQYEGMSRSPRFAAKTSLDDDDEVEGNEDRGKEHEDAVTEEEEEEDGGNHVAKLIKNHESIIKKKSEELVPPKLELTKRQKSNDSSRRVIDGIAARLDSLLVSSTKLNEDLWDVDRVKILMITYSEKRDSETDRDCHDHEVAMDSLDDVWLKVHRRSVSDEATSIRTLREEKEDAETTVMILEDIYLTLFKGLVSGFCMDLHAYELLGLKTKEEHRNIVEEILNNGEEEIESEKIRFGLTEDICRLVLDNAIECFSSCGNQMPQNCVDCLENDLKEDVNGVVFKETLREWKICTERRRGDEEFRQEMHWILTQEFLRHVSEDAKNRTSELLERFEANSKRANEEERSRTHGLVQCCRRMSQVSEDLEFKIQEKLKMVNLRFGELNTKLHSTKNCIGSLRENECLYRKAFILRCENLRKAETEVDLLGDQVDSLVGLLQNTLRTLDQHPQLQQNYSDISEISTTIKKKLLGDVSSEVSNRHHLCSATAC